jgi:predicted permease
VDAGLLSVAGGASGVWLSSVALVWIPTRLPSSVPFLTAPALDLRAAGFAFLAGLAVTVAMSAWPALRLRTLSAAPRGISLPARVRVYRVLVAAQVAIGVALAVPAALLGESLSALRGRDPGFAVDGVLVVDVSVGSHAAAPLSRTARFERDVTDTISAAPGVAGAAFAYDHPLESNWTQVIAMKGEVPEDPGFEGDAHLRIVSPSYFEALGVRVLEGRPFEDGEGTDAPGVALVNEAFAAAHGGRVVGRHFRDMAGVTAWGPVVPGEYEIVGVVANERFRGVDLPSAPAFYLSTRQFPQTSATLLVRAANHSADLPSRIRGLIRGVEPAATIGQVRSLSDILSEQLVSRRVTSGVTSVFAVATVGLALLGLYGLMAVIVAGRTRDVGVRLALGASPVTIARTIVVESVGAAIVGVAAGLALTAVLGRFLEHLLVDVSARDPWTVMVVAGTVLTGAVLAAAGPARRAARIDPVVALRIE